MGQSEECTDSVSHNSTINRTLFLMTGEKTELRPGKAASPVLVLFATDTSRGHAVGFCDELVTRFWADHGFDITWYSFSDLMNSAANETAARKALEAEMIIFAIDADDQFPIETKSWIESWIGRRHDREGALVGLLDCGKPGSPTTEKHVYLRNAAHRAGMDYLTQVPQTISRGIPDSLESYSARAEHVSSVLDEILHQRERPMVPITGA